MQVLVGSAMFGLVPVPVVPQSHLSTHDHWSPKPLEMPSAAEETRFFPWQRPRPREEAKQHSPSIG